MVHLAVIRQSFYSSLLCRLPMWWVPHLASILLWHPLWWTGWRTETSWQTHRQTHRQINRHTDEYRQWVTDRDCGREQRKQSPYYSRRSSQHLKWKTLWQRMFIHYNISTCQSTDNFVSLPVYLSVSVFLSFLTLLICTFQVNLHSPVFSFDPRLKQQL